MNDVIQGRIHFLLVRLKIKEMELQLLKREVLGYGKYYSLNCSSSSPSLSLGPNAFSDVETLLTYQIMDGSPTRGQCVPIRLYLKGHVLNPTMRDVYRKFSVRFFLNLVLLDEENRRYFKQQVSFFIYLRCKFCCLPCHPPSSIDLLLFNQQMLVGLSKGDLCKWFGWAASS